MGNHLAGAGLGIVIGSNTQNAVISAQDTFREAAEKALEADPVLAKQICGGGAMSGKAALVIAYAVMAVGIFPVAKMELDEKIQARKERQLANESGA